MASLTIPVGQEQSALVPVESFAAARAAELEGTSASVATTPRRRKPLLHLADRIFGRAHCITQQKLDIIMGVVGPRLGLSTEMPPVAAFWDDDNDEMEQEDEPDYWKFQDGVASIPVHGTLVKRSGGMSALSGMTSYDSLKSQISKAIDDPNVLGIVLDVDSPGGESDGMFELADYLYSQRGQKPMVASCNSQMCSAAYALGSSCDSIYITQTGMIGSVGCYMVHVDQSAQDKLRGLKYTFISAGAKKVEGNSHEPLDKSAEATMQGEVDRIRSMFVSLVARNRNVTAEAVMATEAGVDFGPAGIPLFADKLGTYEDAVADVLAKIAANQPGDKEELDEEALAIAATALSSGLAITASSFIPGWVVNQPGLVVSPSTANTTTGTSLGNLNSTVQWTVQQTVQQPATTPADAGDECSECDGTGECQMCGGTGKADGEDCPECGGSGKCQACDGSGKMKSYVIWRPMSSALTRLNAERPEIIAAFGHRAQARVVQLPGSRSESPAIGRRISMLVVPYDGSLSVNLGGYREVYQRGCFAQGLDNDPRALFNHDEAFVLGRKSAGTATFWEDAVGVHVEVEAPETTWANDLLVSMRRGDITQASAGFWILQQRWESRSGEKVRVVEKALLRDAAVLAFAAYESTSASVQPTPVPAAEHATTELDGARLRLLRLR